jgi:hypothetical protein
VTFVPWKDLESECDDTLVLGNGASIAAHSRFGYDSLFEKAASSGLLTARVQQIFRELGTKDFEQVLQALRIAGAVNRRLKHPERYTGNAQRLVRRALISAVRDIHPLHSLISHRLEPMARFMGRFRIVISLNYDLLVYWALMHGRTRLGLPFDDCFPNGRFERNWYRLLVLDRAIGVFYPHGNLALIRDDRGNERKLSAREVPLLDRVLKAWSDKGVVPLFVSEGTSKGKLQSIQRSPYLSTVYHSVLPGLSKLPGIGSSVVVYGCSFRDEDQHILDAIGCGEVKTFAVSIPPGRTRRSRLWYCARVRERIRRTAGLARTRIHFFLAGSPGAWIN